MRSVQSILFTLLLFFTGCNDREEKSPVHLYSAFPKTIEIKESTPVASITQLEPWDIYKVDSLFIVFEYRGSDYFYHVYDEDFNYLGPFGRKGKGPGEFQFLDFSSQYEMDSLSNIKLWIYDTEHYRGYKIDLKSAINATDDSFIEKKVKLPVIVQTIPQAFFIKDGDTVIGRSDMYSKGRYFVFDTKTEILTWFPQVPEIDDFTHPELHQVTNYSHTRLSMDGRFLYSAMLFFPRIDVFDINGELVRTIMQESKVPDPIVLDKNSPINPDNIEYFYDLEICDKYIYVSYHGRSMNQWQKEKRENAEVKGHIFVFNMDGQPLYDLVFPRHIGKFCIDYDRKQILTFDYDSETSPVVSYPLPI